MTINELITNFGGKPVVDWNPGDNLTNPAETCFRISLSYDAEQEGEEWPDLLSKFLENPEASQVYGIVVGNWGEMYTGTEAGFVAGALESACEYLPNLKALFLGDVTYEECEISWILQTNITPTLQAYPNLEHLGVRGGSGLSLGSIRHEHLKSLTIQTGGLNASVVRAVTAADFPELEHLELWLGTENYGATTEPVDLAPLFSGRLFPKLKYLGLRNSDFSDLIATAMADSPLLERLETLDLSLGTLGDEGAEALLKSPATAKLRFLDLHHHYCSDEMMEKLKALGIKVDLSDAQGECDQDDRYVEVGE